MSVDPKKWGKHEGVVIYLRRPDGLIYMAQRLRTDRPYLGHYSAPGGSVEEGETQLGAAVRETQEETALVLDATRLYKLGRTGPHICPVEQQGSGTPFHMTFYGCDLRTHEIPTRTEPTKQGPWQARSVSEWIFDAVTVAREHAVLELMRQGARR